MYDAIVVGARCAGSATAMRLARKGYRVLLVDKATFPSDTLSTHYIHQPGVASLARWGLLDQVAAQTPRIERQIFDVGPFALCGTPPPAEGQTAGYAPRRKFLDKVLVDAAVSAGAELRERFSVKDLVIDDGRVTGIRGRSEGGAEVTERARLVIGADGMRSIVAQQVDAPIYNEKPASSCAYYTYWSGVPVDAVELYPRPDRMLIAAPTNDDLTLTIVYWPEASFPEVRANIEQQFLDALDLVPDLGARVRSGERAERFSGSGQLHGFLRKPCGPGWALVGDAGYHKSPITAEGITDAFRDAELLAGTLDDVFAGRASEADALAAYEETRNATVMPIYEMTAELATLQPPPPDMQQLFGALAGNQEQIDRFFGTLAGTVPIPEFFSPESLGKITSGVSA